MAKYTHTAPAEHIPVRWGVPSIEVEEALSAPQQAEEIASALGVPVDVGPVAVPVPGLVGLALLEQIASPFLATTDRDLETIDALRALYILTEPRKAAITVAAALRTAAALDAVTERATADPALWDAYLDAVALSGRRGWSAFDTDVAAFGETLGAAPVMDLASAIAHQVALASRGYEMIPEGAEGPKDGAASE